MAVAKWNTPSAQGTNIASTSLDSLANGSSSSRVTYDNSSNLDLYALITVNLGSFTSTSGASFTFRVFLTSGSGPDVNDDTSSVGGGEPYPVPITVGASAKVAVFRVLLPPASLRFSITNNSGATFASSGNSIKVQPYNEAVS